MTNIRELLIKSKYEQVRDVLERAGRIGKSKEIAVYAVGGLVRDLLMDKVLNDIDIMTVGEGIPFAKLLARELDVKKIVPFEKFGTALIPYKPVQIEVASARRETYDDHSRKPSDVIHTDLNGDLLRRDFTINTMAMDIWPGQFGDLFMSRIKRSLGIKDSSDSLPGHGGFLDRVDSYLLSFAFLLLVSQFYNLNT